MRRGGCQTGLPSGVRGVSTQPISLLPWSLVAAIAMASGCGGEPREDAEQPVTTATGGPSAGSGDADGTGEGTVGGTADGTAGGGIKLDVAGGVDLGGGGTVGDCDSLEELPTNQGCEFWALDLPNVSEVPPLSIDTVPADQQFAVVVTNPSDMATANVEIFVADQATPVVSGPVPVETMRVFQLPALNITPGATTSDGQAYRIASDLPIIAYQFQPLDNTSPVYSNDATLLFPTHVLTGDYTAITGDATLVDNDGFAISDANTGAFVSVVGVEDETTVTLYPTGGLLPGAYEDVVLARGAVLTAISSERGAPSWGNLSGTRVVADKPVAVFSGSVSTSEPSDANVCCADHLEHQMLPLSAWGASYAFAPAAAAAGGGSDESLVRITGAFDGTALVYDPATPAGAPASIDAGETVAFVTEAAFTVHATDETQAFAVSQFLLSNQYFNEPLGRPGDPTMILLPAVAQFQDNYVFLMPQGYRGNFVTVVRPQGVPMTLDGGAAPGAFAPLGNLDGTDYEYAHVQLEPGNHTIEADEPFGIIVAGHATDVSYGYTGGSGVGVISTPPPPPAG